MISINKEECEYIREHFPNVYIVRTMKQKSKRHRYYCEEYWKVLKYLKEERNGISTSKSTTVKREGVDYNSR